MKYPFEYIIPFMCFHNMYVQLHSQVFGALAEYAFILRQIIQVSRQVKKEEELFSISNNNNVGSPRSAVAVEYTVGGGVRYVENNQGYSC